MLRKVTVSIPSAPQGEYVERLKKSDRWNDGRSIRVYVEDVVDLLMGPGDAYTFSVGENDGTVFECVIEATKYVVQEPIIVLAHDKGITMTYKEPFAGITKRKLEEDRVEYLNLTLSHRWVLT